jgi:hypothetical protein
MIDWIDGAAMKHRAIANPAVAQARLRFETGDRVRHTKRGWTGTVTAEPSDSGLAWVQFDDVGMYGADPRKLKHA